jgi:Flp pilus assembly protein TadG
MPARISSKAVAAFVRRALSAARFDRRGNVAITFALAIIPMIALMGLGLDYYRKLSNKARLDAAADAAALAAISAAQSYVNNNTSQSGTALTNGAIAAGQAQGVLAFNANAGTSENAVSLDASSPSVVLTRVKGTQTFNAAVTYSAKMPASFGGLVGVNTLNVGGSSSSSLTMGKYLDFYLVLDVSGSMGIPTAISDQTLLAKNNPDNSQYKTTYPTGCQFACHYPGSGGFQYTRTAGINLRVDTVGQAVQALLATAGATQTLKNQYRVGLYPFIVDAIEAAPLSSCLGQSSTGLSTCSYPTPANSVYSVAGNLANYLDQGAWTGSTINNGMGSGGTHFENLWTDVKPFLQPVGDGTSATSPQPFILLVTDGMDNNQTDTPATAKTGIQWTGSQPKPPSVTFCTNAKAAGYTVAVIYVPYIAISPPNASFAGGEDTAANNAIPSLPGLLGAGTPPQTPSCASPGYFFTADSAASINGAMQAIFAQATAQARLTH